MKGKVTLTKFLTPEGDEYPLELEVDFRQLALRTQTNVLLQVVDHQNAKATEAIKNGKKRPE